MHPNLLIESALIDLPSGEFQLFRIHHSWHNIRAKEEEEITTFLYFDFKLKKQNFFFDQCFFSLIFQMDFRFSFKPPDRTLNVIQQTSRIR